MPLNHMESETESETGERESDEQFPVQILRNRLDAVEEGDGVEVTYRSRQSGNPITASGDVAAVKAVNGAIWWADIATEDGRTVRVEDGGDVETVRGDGGTQILGAVRDFQREGVNEPEVMTDGGVDTTRGQRWSSKHPRRRERERVSGQMGDADE